MELAIQQNVQEFKVFHLFCGIGGGALGFEMAQSEYKGIVGKFRTIGGIDCDPLCIENFNRLTAGEPGTVMDLFDRGQYTDFWGKEPPEEWKEAVPEDIRKAAHGQTPDVIFLSPPCKGFSGLLPEKSSRTPKYQALNKLVVRSMWLVLQAFKYDLPAAILIENVPRITRRGAALLAEVKKLLASCGYEFHEGTHDCGEIGGLGQTRKRYLLIARNPKKLMSFIYQPPRYRLKSIGEVLESVPMPGDIERAGKMHRIPNLQWKTWVRLALIPAGKDWRALNRDCHANLYQIVPWDRHSATIAGVHRPNNGAVSVADPRLDKVCGYGNKFKITADNEPAPTVTGSRIGSGAVLYGDKRLNHEPRAGAFRVMKWEETAPAVTGSTGTGRSNGISGVADPRLGCEPRSGAYGVSDWTKPSSAVTGSFEIDNRPASVADPRIPKAEETQIPQDTQSGVWVIISEDGSWHRPITTFEMAMLQGLPSHFLDGSLLELAGNSEKVWREHIGNMVPPPAACGIATSMLETMLPNMIGHEWYWNVRQDAKIWVRPVQ